MFKLYRNIEARFVTKEDTRKALLQHGLVRFQPSNADRIGFPQEIHHKGTVAILQIENITLHKGAKIIVCDDGVYSGIKIMEIKIDSQAVSTASNGEIGVKFNRSILNTSELWVARR